MDNSCSNSRHSSNLYQHLASPLPRPPTPSFPQRRCSSLPPPSHRLKPFCGPQLGRSQSCIHLVSKGNCSSFLTHQLAPSQTPPSPSISHQQQLDNQNEHLRTLTAHAVLTVETQVSSSTPTLSGACPLDHQSSNSSLKSRLSQVDEDHLDEVLAPNGPIATYCSS